MSAPKRLEGVDAPTLKEEGVDVELANWRSVVAAPGISPEQRDALIQVVDKMHASPAWREVLKQKGWDDFYLSGDAFGRFLKEEQARVKDVLTSVGLVK